MKAVQPDFFDHGQNVRRPEVRRQSPPDVNATLERAGVISQGRGRLTVHDPDALRNYVY